MALTKDGLLAGMSNIAPQTNAQIAGGLGAQSAFAQKQQAGTQFAATGGQAIAKPQAAQMAATQAGDMTKARLSAAQTTVQQQGQLGQQAITEQKTQATQQLGEKKLALQKKQRQLENSLSALGEEVKNKLFADNMTFQQDELGRTAWNERQLGDWKIRQAKDAQELARYEQQVRQASARKQQLYKTAYAKITQELQNISSNNILNADMKTKERLMRAKASMEQKMRDEANAAANRLAMGKAIGTMVGGAAGAAIFQTPQGAAAGGNLGSGLGTAATGAFGG